MKRRPYRLKIRPVRRRPELNLKFDFNLKPSFSRLFLSAPAHYPPALVQPYAPRPITAADVAPLAEAFKPMSAALRALALAFRMAPLLSPAYLERLRAAQDARVAAAAQQKSRAQAWLDEATNISREQYLDLRLRSCPVLNPRPVLLVSTAF